MKNSVKFDPGIGNFVVDFNEFVNGVYSQMMSFRTIHQKRGRFNLYVNKIEKYMKNNISFYAGCLLWAYYLTTLPEVKTIEGNAFLNLTDEQKEDYDYMIQVNFMDNYFDSYERDVLFYTGKKYEISNVWKNILEMYSEFLEINEGFVDTKLTSDIKLPEKLKMIKLPKDINSVIEKAIKEENLEVILENVDFSLNS